MPPASTVHAGDTEHHVITQVNPSQFQPHGAIPGVWVAETEFHPNTMAQILGAAPGETADAQLSTAHGGISGKQIMHVGGLSPNSLYASQLDFKHQETGVMTPFDPVKNVHVISGTQALQGDCVYLPGGGASNVATYSTTKTPTEEAIHLTNKWRGKDPEHCFLGTHELPADAAKDKKARLLVPLSSDVPTNPVSHLIETTPQVAKQLGLLPSKVEHEGNQYHVVHAEAYKTAAEQVKGVLDKIQPSVQNTVVRHYVQGEKPKHPIFVHKKFITGGTPTGPRAVTATIPADVVPPKESVQQTYGLDLTKVQKSTSGGGTAD